MSRKDIVCGELQKQANHSNPENERKRKTKKEKKVERINYETKKIVVSWLLEPSM